MAIRWLLPLLLVASLPGCLEGEAEGLSDVAPTPMAPVVEPEVLVDESGSVTFDAIVRDTPIGDGGVFGLRQGTWHPFTVSNGTDRRMTVHVSWESLVPADLDVLITSPTKQYALLDGGPQQPDSPVEFMLDDPPAGDWTVEAFSDGVVVLTDFQITVRLDPSEPSNAA